MKRIKTSILLAVFICSSVVVFSQCETWLGLSNENNLTDSFVIYRDFLKQKKFDKAFPLWETVYKKVPAADGRRNHVYTDGIKLYVHKFENEKRKKRKSEYVQVIQKLIEELLKCYPDSKFDLPRKEILDFRSEL